MTGRLNSLNNGYVGGCVEIPTTSVSTGVVNTRKQYIRALEMDQWERPAYWLPLPVITEGSERFAGLYAIFKGASGDTGASADSNWATIQCRGAYIVDWGVTTPSRPNGFTQAFADNAIAVYQYNWENVPNSTLTPEGHKQVVITVTPQSGSNLTTIDFTRQPTGLSFPSVQMPSEWLDLRISAPNVSILNFNNTGTGRMIMPHVKQIEIIGTTALTVNAVSLFSGCYGLERLIGTKWSRNVTSLNSTFNSCLSLRTIPLLETAKVNNMQDAFSGCYSLHTLPCINTAGVTNANNCFSFCTSLTDIPMLNTSLCTTMVQIFNSTNALETIPLLDTSKVTNFNSAFYDSRIKKLPPINTSSAKSMNQMFRLCSRLDELPLLDTSQCEDMTSMFQSATALTTIPSFDTRKVKTFNSFALGCTSLRNLPNLSFAGITGAFSNTAPVLGTMFGNNRGLMVIPQWNVSGISFGPTSASSAGATGPFNQMFDSGTNQCNAVRVIGISGAVRSLSFANMCLSPTEVNRVFTNLGNVTAYGGATINMSGVWGLTAGVSGPNFVPGGGTADRTIATSKGWTVIG